ncbi:50S ribosomal protein L10 [Bacillus sp. SN10]|uniref:50S ribosomal protein L10 n=1 Tax=Bacillus sp. SN10 TaxID=2056493 RepID=UPI0026B87F87
MKFRGQTTRYLQELRADTNADTLAKFIVYNHLYELALDKTNFELVKVLTEELALLQTELQRVPPANKHLQKQIKKFAYLT